MSFKFSATFGIVLSRIQQILRTKTFYFAFVNKMLMKTVRNITAKNFPLGKAFDI